MFDVQAHEKLGFYVYALFDPRKPRVPFYIGKGCGNRIFAHTADEVPAADFDNEFLSAKLALIREIQTAGQEVMHKILRFRLSEEEAFKVEGSLIDMVNHMHPGTLTNQISGQGIADGIHDARDLAVSLQARELVANIPLLLIKIERKWSTLLGQYGSAADVPSSAIYEATRESWKLNPARANRAECVLAIARGLVRDVFVPTGWSEPDENGRRTMTGQTDPSKYLHLKGRSVAHLFERGSQHPLRYLLC